MKCVATKCNRKLWMKAHNFIHTVFNTFLLHFILDVQMYRLCQTVVRKSKWVRIFSFQHLLLRFVLCSMRNRIFTILIEINRLFLFVFSINLLYFYLCLHFFLFVSKRNAILFIMFMMYFLLHWKNCHLSHLVLHELC